MTNSSDTLLLKQMEIGPLQNFIYFIGDARTREIAVVDPAWDVPLLCREAETLGATIKAVLLTHGHPDHVNGLEELLARHPVDVYISRHEAPFYKPRVSRLVEVGHQAEIQIGQVTLSCLHTPGHTPGGQCFLCQNVLLTGDTLFIDGCGRCDLPGGDAETLYESLHQVIMPLPDETILYTGHNYGPVPYATLGEQKKTNPYLMCRDKEEFLHNRMGL